MREADGAETPMRAATPMRASTPSHDAWHPTTPSRSASAWEASTSEYGGIGGPYGFVSSTTSTPFSPFSPAPPAARNERDDLLLPRTPSEGLYNPATPSGGYTPHPVYSEQPTPGGMSEVSTPGYTPYAGTPPAYPTTPATPGGALPQTPGTPMGRVPTPATPGVISYDLERTPAATFADEPWATEGIEVHISDAFHGGQHKDHHATAVITSVARDSCRISLRDKENNEVESLSVPTQYLEPALPTKDERGKVVRGELKGSIGQVVAINGTDALIKIPGQDVRLLDLSLLARYNPIDT